LQNSVLLRGAAFGQGCGLCQKSIENCCKMQGKCAANRGQMRHKSAALLRGPDAQLNEILSLD